MYICFGIKSTKVGHLMPIIITVTLPSCIDRVYGCIANEKNRLESSGFLQLYISDEGKEESDSCFSIA